MVFHRSLLRRCLLASAFFAIAVAASSALHAATFIIVNNDGAGEGFNDPTAVAPVGGNTGTTLGAQRLIAFQYAANIWGSILSSPIQIRVGATFDPMTPCNASSGILGMAGPVTTRRDFVGAPVAGTWYAIALANSLNGSDMDPSEDDITAEFNSSVGVSGCLTTSGWYYGLDGNVPGNRLDFVSVLLHELGHGLGFLTLVDLASGAKALGFNDTYMLNLENHGASPSDYPSMTNAQRVAASIATGNLHWVGPHVQAASGRLTAGKVGTHVQMFAPNPQQSGSSVSHWDTALTPNQVMEPTYTEGLHSPVMEVPAFQDMGWKMSASLATHDFDGSSKSDIAWRQNTGAVALWLMNAGSIASSGNLGTIGATFSIVGQRDFDGNGKADLLWRDTSGTVYMWFLNGTTVASSTAVGNVPTSWTIKGTGDLNGDGKGDLLWQDTSGNVAVWFMNGAAITSSLPLGAISPSTWTLLGDATGGMLWRDTSGNLALWRLNGSNVVSGGLGNVPSNWVVRGIGDFNADGFVDILFRDTTTGAVAIWFLNSAGQVQSTATVGTVSNATTWQVAETGDFNGDGNCDILWIDGSGNVAIWFMNGSAIASTVGLGSVGTTWTVQTTNVE